MTRKVVVTDYTFPGLEPERSVLDPIGCVIEARQCRTEQDVIDACRDADAVLNQFAPITREVLRRLNKCQIVVRYGIGVDNVDVAAAEEFGIPVANVPDYGVQEVADHTVSLLLAAVRKIPHIYDQVRRGVWENAAMRPVIGLAGKEVGLLGFGNIARAVAERLHGFRLRVTAYDPYVDDRVFREAGVARRNWRQLLAQSDIVCVHLPLTAETRHFINRDTLALMKPSAYLINTSRGGVLRTADVAEALGDAAIAGAALDVLEEEPIAADHPLLRLPNCIVTSHVAWYSEDSIVRLQQYAAMEVRRVFEGEPPRHPVRPR